MPVRHQSDSSEKAAVSVSEAAALCGLSRTHFHALIKSGIMPPPCYDMITRRPFYPRELLDDCLRIRRTNQTADGRYVLFYQPRQRQSGPSPQARPSRRSNAAASTAATPARHAELVEGLRSLGLASVTDGHVDAALRVCFPNGVGATSEGEVLRSVWQQVRRSQAV
jgi:hypothetical protein